MTSTDWTYRHSDAEVSGAFQRAVQSGCVGKQPAFLVHDLSMMQRRLQAAKDAFPSQTLHTVAIKANPLVSVLEQACRAGAGLEAASLEEVALARAAGCEADRIVFDSPAKTRTELEQALAWGICINADNTSELERIHDILQGTAPTSRIGLRVNTQVGSGTISTTSVAGRESKFGVPLQDEKTIEQAFHRFPWLQGLHAHVGSQGCAADLLVSSATRLAALRASLHASLGESRIEWIDIGGGLPVAYSAGERPPSVGAYATQLRQAAPSLFEEGVQLITEFGRAIQAGCGIAYSRIEYVKHDGRLGVTHLGADMFLRWVYHPQDWSHEVLVLDAEGVLKVTGRAPRSIAGPLCFGGDFLLREQVIPAIEPGDWLAIRDVGAYTLSMWSRHCNRGLPLVLGYESDRDSYESDCDSPVNVLRAAESLTDVVDFWR